MTTKRAFICEYKERLIAAYPWTQDKDKLDRFLSSCLATMDGSDDSWNHDGDIARDAYKAIGGKGTMTLKALRALPMGD